MDRRSSPRARRPAAASAGGGRWVEVDPARLDRWLAGFAERHGPPSVAPPGEDGPTIRLVAPDGSEAELHPPPGAASARTIEEFVVEAARERRIGLVLARQASVAVGVAAGARLVVSKVDSSYVQGRTAAGGWSQQRFARRRENQAKAAAGSASDLVARLLLPELERLDAVVTGGDRRTVDIVLSDPRLVAVLAARSDRFLDVPQPRLAVLEQAVARSRSVLIRVRDPDSD